MIAVLRLSLPITVWLVSFSAVYGLHGIVCSFPWGTSEGPWAYTLGHLVLIAASAVAIAAQVTLLAALSTRRFGGPAGFVRRVSLALAVVALVATVWTLAPVAALAPCEPQAYSATVQSSVPHS